MSLSLFVHTNANNGTIKKNHRPQIKEFDNEQSNVPSLADQSCYNIGESYYEPMKTTEYSNDSKIWKALKKQRLKET